MGTTPACRECKRTHTSTGKPLRLKATGEHRGICEACRKRLGMVAPDLVRLRALERDRSALEYWLNTVYRRRRRVNHSLSH